MNKVIAVDRIPEKSIILKNFGKVDYQDTYRIDIEANGTVDHITTGIFKTPKWVDNLMKLRDYLVRGFGLKTGGKKDANIDAFYPIGSKAVYFTVSDRNDSEIVMAESDKHLNFRTSVMTDRSEAGTVLYISTIVYFNNFFGRLYFLPVKPFHRIIVKSLLKRYKME
jgi:hypothetical protein